VFVVVVVFLARYDGESCACVIVFPPLLVLPSCFVCLIGFIFIVYMWQRYAVDWLRG
jgi:hypothetical protein